MARARRCPFRSTAPNRDHSSEQQELARFSLLASLQPIQIDTRGQLFSVVIPAIPADGVGSGLAGAADQGDHLLTGQVVESQFHGAASGKGEADNRTAVERVGMVLR